MQGRRRRFRRHPWGFYVNAPKVSTEAAIALEAAHTERSGSVESIGTKVELRGEIQGPTVRP